MATIGEILAMGKTDEGRASLAGVDPLGVATDPSYSDVNELPLGFRLRLQFARQRPEDLVSLLQASNMQMEPVSEDGRIVVRSEDGKRYPIDTLMPGPSAIQHGPKMLLQGLLTVGSGGAGVVPAAVASSLAGTAYEEGMRGLLGQTPSTKDMASDMTLSVGAEAATRGLGGLGRAITGKTTALRSAMQAEEKALQASAMAQEGALASFNMTAMNAVETEATTIAKENMRKEFANAYGMPLDKLAALREESIPSLSKRTQAVKDAIKGAGNRVFDKVSQQYKAVLGEWSDKPVEANFAAPISAAELFAAKHSHSINPGLAREIETLRGMGGSSSYKYQGREINLANLPPEARAAIAGEGGGLTVDKLRGTATNFRRLAMTATNGRDRKIASDIAESVDDTIASVLPEDVQQALKTELNPQWHELNQLVSGSFKKSLRTTSNPAQLANAFIGTKVDQKLNVQRFHNLLSEVTPEEMPVVRSAIAERIASEQDPASYLADIDPGVLRRLWPGTGLDNPAAMEAAFKAQYRLDALLQDPAYVQRLADAAEKGFNSTAGKMAKSNLDAIEARAASDVAAAREAGGVAALQKRGAIANAAKQIQFGGAMALFGTGRTTEAMFLAPIILGSAAFSHYMADPKMAATYFKLLQNPVAETLGNFVGRLGAASAAEYGKTVSRERGTRDYVDSPVMALPKPGR